MKVLILCYDFPPLISIGGQRPNSWFNYLPESAIGVTVITRHWHTEIHHPTDYVRPTTSETSVFVDDKGNKIIRVPFHPNFRDRLLLKFGFNRFSTVRKFFSLFYTFAEFLMFRFDSRAAIYHEAEKQIHQERPDFVIATAEPFILFKYAHLLAKKYGIKWVADYRDGWTNNQGAYQYSCIKKFQNAFFRKQEKKYLGNVDFVTTAAPAYAKALMKIHPEKKVEIIYNGYDEKYFEGIEKITQSNSVFVITYAGILYAHQNLEMFLEGLSVFIKQHHIQPQNMEVRFYGLDGQPESKKRVLNYNESLKPFIKLLPKISYKEIVVRIRESRVLLVLSKAGADWLNAKVFDYFAARRPVLLVENDKGILDELIRETEAGFAADNAVDVAMFLSREYNKFLQKQQTESTLNNSYTKYSRRKQATVFAQLLTGI